jgi:hypothetical protein
MSEPQQSTSATETDEASILQQIISVLKPLGDEDKIRLLRTVSTFFKLDTYLRGSNPTTSAIEVSSRPAVITTSSFSERKSLSPKEFMFEKAPQTDVERIVCLGFYLTHYRDTPHFKTLDLSKLGTEGAQPKFSNAAYSADHAVKRGFLVPATKGNRQLSALGEQFVQALPDRAAAKDVLERFRVKRYRPRKKSKEADADDENNSEAEA